jgi:hypothetical protein
MGRIAIGAATIDLNHPATVPPQRRRLRRSSENGNAIPIPAAVRKARSGFALARCGSVPSRSPLVACWPGRARLVGRRVARSALARPAAGASSEPPGCKHPEINAGVDSCSVTSPIAVPRSPRRRARHTAAARSHRHERDYRAAHPAMSATAVARWRNRSNRHDRSAERDRAASGIQTAASRRPDRSRR